MALFTATVALGQSGVSINDAGTAPDADAILDISSSAKGVLLPRVADHTSLTPDANSDYGLAVFNTTTKSYWFWDGTAWQEIPTVANTGNTLDEAYDEGGAGAGRIINATDGNVEIQGSGHLTVAANVGIGTTTPAEKLEVHFTDRGGILIDGNDGDDAFIQIENGGGSHYIFDDDDGNHALKIESATNRDIAFNTSGANERMVVQSDGRVRVNNLAEPTGAVITSNAAGVLGKTPLTNDPNDVLLGTGAFGSSSVFDDQDWYQVGSTNTPTAISDYIHTEGHVGIGNNFGPSEISPSSPLQVTASGSGNPNTNSIMAYNPTNLGGNDAIITARVAGSNAGDPFFSLDISGEAGWSMGIDNDHDNRFKIAPSWSNLSAGTSMTMQTDGNVGIGTTTPDAKLNIGDAVGATLYLTREDNVTTSGDVLGSILFDSTDDTGLSTTDASAGIRAYASQDHGNSNKGAHLGFFTKNNSGTGTSATERLRILSNGNIGVGTSTPASIVHVSTTQTGNVSKLHNPSLGNGSLVGHEFGKANSTNNMAEFRYNHVSDGNAGNWVNLGLWGNANTLNVVGTGNVGIGTTGPAQKLEVAGNTRITGLGGAGDRLVYTNNSGDLLRSTSGINPNSLVDGSGATNRVAYWADANSLTSNGNFTYDGNNLYVANPESSTATVRLGAAWNRPGVYSSQELQLFSDQTGIIFGDSNNERMRMTAAGNFGIGTTGPAEKLHVNGSLRVEDGQINSGTDNIRFMEGVRANDNSYEWAGFYSGTTRQGIILYDGQWTGANNLTNEFSITADNNNLLTLNTNSNHIALMPDGSGKVGVKTLAPISPLTVAVPATNTIPLDDPTNAAGITVLGTTDNTRLQMGVGGNTLGPYAGWLQVNYSDGSPTGGVTGRMLLNPMGGQVGVGLPNPGAHLTVRQGTTDPGVYDDGKTMFVTGPMGSGQSYDGGVEFRHDNLTQGVGIGYNTIYQTGTNANQELNIITKGNGPVTINAHGGASGNVGIGTTTPTEKLHIDGKLTFTGDPNRMSKTPRVVHIEDSRGGCPGNWSAGESLIRYGITTNAPAMVYITSSIIRSTAGRADLELRLGTNSNPNVNPIVDRTLTYTSSTQWEDADVHWSGNIGAGVTSVSITSPQSSVWGCGAGWGSMDIIIFEQ